MDLDALRIERRHHLSDGSVFPGRTNPLKYYENRRFLVGIQPILQIFKFREVCRKSSFTFLLVEPQNLGGFECVEANHFALGSAKQFEIYLRHVVTLPLADLNEAENVRCARHLRDAGDERIGGVT